MISWVEGINAPRASCPSPPAAGGSGSPRGRERVANGWLMFHARDPPSHGKARQERGERTSETGRRTIWNPYLGTTVPTQAIFPLSGLGEQKPCNVRQIPWRPTCARIRLSARPCSNVASAAPSWETRSRSFARTGASGRSRCEVSAPLSSSFPALGGVICLLRVHRTDHSPRSLLQLPPRATSLPQKSQIPKPGWKPTP